MYIRSTYLACSTIFWKIHVVFQRSGRKSDYLKTILVLSSFKYNHKPFSGSKLSLSKTFEAAICVASAHEFCQVGANVEMPWDYYAYRRAAWHGGKRLG